MCLMIDNGWLNAPALAKLQRFGVEIRIKYHIYNKKIPHVGLSDFIVIWFKFCAQ